MGRQRNLLLFALGYFLVLEAMLVAAILFWPEFVANLGAIRALAGSIPMVSQMLDDIGVSFFGYVASQHWFKGCSTLGSAAAVLFAVGAVAGEAHRGTLEILLARPFSRRRILTERYVAGFLAFALPVFLSSLTIPWLASLVDEECSLVSVLLCSAHEVVFLSVIYGAAFLLSTRSSNPLQIAFGVLAPTILAFAVYMVKVVSSYSPFRLADIAVHLEIDRTGSLDLAVLLPLAATTVVLFLLAQRSFARRLP